MKNKSNTKKKNLVQYIECVLPIFRICSRPRQERQLLRALMWSGLQKYHTINFAQKPLQTGFQLKWKESISNYPNDDYYMPLKNRANNTHHLIASWNGNMYTYRFLVDQVFAMWHIHTKEILCLNKIYLTSTKLNKYFFLVREAIFSTYYYPWIRVKCFNHLLRINHTKFDNNFVSCLVHHHAVGLRE